MKSKAFIFSLLIVFVLLLSCDDKQSLQEYYIENSEKGDFISIDVPASILNLSEVSLTEEQRSAYESVKKLNILAFRLNEGNKTEYEVEKSKVKDILNDTKYQELMTFNNGKQRGTVKFLGTEDAIDEVIIFGSDNKRGFALIRVLGNDMKPGNMVKLMDVMDKADIDGEEFGELKGFFSK
jgi:Domain of unknown function (DUF4252)